MDTRVDLTQEMALGVCTRVGEAGRQMKEAALERLLTAEMSRIGGIAYKIDASARRGAPDRVSLVKGIVTFVELKSERGVVSPMQSLEHERIRQAGGRVLVLRGASQVRAFCREI